MLDYMWKQVINGSNLYIYVMRGVRKCKRVRKGGKKRVRESQRGGGRGF